jgi:hypothetical protein
MRFMIMHKLTPTLEAGVMPSPEEIAEIHGMMGEAGAAGLLRGGNGLRPSRLRQHVVYRGGKRTVTEGPFEGLGELPASFLSLQVRTRDEALAWLDRVAAIQGDLELVLGLCTEAWDLGIAPKPEDPPLRLLAVFHADARTERDQPLEPEALAALRALFEDMRKAGVLHGVETLRSSRHGARIFVEQGAASTVDGPFAESKQLLSGYAIFELPSKQEAVEWGRRWAHTVRVHEVEVREC